MANSDGEGNPLAEGFFMGFVVGILILGVFRLIFWFIRAWFRLCARLPIVFVPITIGLILCAGWAYIQSDRQAAELQEQQAVAAVADVTKIAAAKAAPNPMKDYVVEFTAPETSLERDSDNTTKFLCLISIKNNDPISRDFLITLKVEYTYGMGLDKKASNKSDTATHTDIVKVNAGETKWIKGKGIPVEVILNASTEDITSAKVMGFTLSLTHLRPAESYGVKTYTPTECDYVAS